MKSNKQIESNLNLFQIKFEWVARNNNDGNSTQTVIFEHRNVFLLPCACLYPSFRRMFIFITFFPQSFIRSMKRARNPANKCMLKVNNRIIRKTCEIFSKLTIKTPE